MASWSRSAAGPRRKAAIRTPPALVVALLLFGSALPGAHAAEVVLEAVPRPSLEGLGEESQAQLEEVRAELDRALDEGAEEDPRARAALYGRMGELYYLYELLIPAGVCFENASRLEPTDYRWPYFLGAIASARGRVDEAVERFTEAARLNPEDAATHLRLGRLYLDRDELGRAERHLRRALELDPESAAAHEGLGRVARARGEHALALDHLQEALRLQPTATSLHHHLGMVYRDLGERELARSHLLQNRHHPVVMRDPLINRLALEGRGPRRYLEAGQRALELGSYEKAVVAFRQVVARSPDDARARYNLALALAGMEQLDESIAELQKALELDPEYGDALFNLGSSLARSGRFDEAAEAFARLAELDPSDTAARVQRANALRRAGRRDEALAAIEEVLATQPEDARALLLSAALLMEGGATEEAVERLRRVVELATTAEDRAEALMALADVARSRGRYAEALEEFQRSLQAVPGSPRALAGVAFSYGALGSYVEAGRAFEELAKRTPRDPEAYFGGAMAWLLADRCASAVSLLRRGLTEMPQSLDLIHLLARVFATCPDEQTRNGPRALELALAVHRSAPRPEHAETVAMAYAETGELEQAIAWQERVVRQLEANGATDRARVARDRLATYRRGEPVRAPWRGE